LVLLAIPSVAAGWTIGKVVYGEYFGSAIQVLPAHPAMAELSEEFHGVWAMMLHGFTALPFWLALAGAVTAWYLYVARPDLPKAVAGRFGLLYALVERKYGFDELYSWLLAGGARVLGTGLWKYGDERLIDGLAVNGTARLVGWVSSITRLFQTGLVYQYAFTMIIGVFVLLTLWFAQP
jgi:NADH-quinone oxidoreductase subunit L